MGSAQFQKVPCSSLYFFSRAIGSFQKIKAVTVSTVSPSICHEVMGLAKSLQMVTAAMKLKDAYSLEEKV